MRTVAVLNHKGGSGKTSTAVNLGAALTEYGQRVLIFDLDPQASASVWLRVPGSDRTILDALLGSRDLAALARPTATPGLEVIPSSPWLVTAERTMQADLSVAILRSVQRLPDRWDLMLIDCPPSIAYLAVGALVASRHILVPVELHRIALTGVRSVLSEAARLRSQLNPDLGLCGIVGNRMNRTLHARWVLEELRREYGDLVLDTTVRESVRVPEAEAAGVPVTAIAPNPPVAADYRSLALEILGRVGVRPRPDAATTAGHERARHWFAFRAPWASH